MGSLALRCGREDRSVGQGRMCVCVCVHDTHRRRTLLCMLYKVWPHRSVLFVCELYVALHSAAGAVL